MLESFIMVNSLALFFFSFIFFTGFSFYFGYGRYFGVVKNILPETV